ncbi:double-stranded RNA-binding protein 1 isoform X1 [Vigna angularis]|uniref:double-stranded RNA-binding protein 1 isoform X1 n=1 Tax=Phaseolus angularis TaxID=3914 RepID=UPI00080A3E44|nr:double-stranded RNA-binding protein 1 isoform X1 [Vigna angularis]
MPLSSSGASSGSSSVPSLTAHVPFPSHTPGGHVMYKNRLQEFTSRSGNGFPVYQTINEGLQHIPKFRSTVRVAGIDYTSKSTFSQKKAAEQDVARLALEAILEKTREEGPSLVNENLSFQQDCTSYEPSTSLHFSSLNQVLMQKKPWICVKIHRCC